MGTGRVYRSRKRRFGPAERERKKSLGRTSSAVMKVMHREGNFSRGGRPSYEREGGGDNELPEKSVGHAVRT